MAKASTDTTITLPEIVGIQYAEELYKQCQKLAKKAEDTTLDASAVERITTPCIQVLLAFERSLANRKKSIQLGDTSDAFRQVFTDLGLEDKLEQWSNQ